MILLQHNNHKNVPKILSRLFIKFYCVSNYKSIIIFDVIIKVQKIIITFDVIIKDYNYF